MHWRKCVVSPLGTCASSSATENHIQGPSPLSLHPTALGKIVDLRQGPSTLQSEKITTPISLSVFFGWSKVKLGEPSTQAEGKAEVEMEATLGGGMPAPAAPSLHWDSAHCLLTKGLCLVKFWFPESLLPNSSLDVSTELIVNTHLIPPGLPWCCPLRLWYEDITTRLRNRGAEGRRKGLFPGAIASAHLHFQGLPENSCSLLFS